MPWSNLKPIDVDKIIAVDFPVDKYFPLEHPKKQIVLHHTVSGEGVRGDIDHWISLASRIATCVIIDHDGIAHQCFSSKYWAHHLGVKSTYLKSKGFTDWSTRNTILNRESIAIEIDSWGGLFLGDGSTRQFGLNSDGKPRMIKTKKDKFYAEYGNIVNVPVVHYPNGYRGYYYYEKYNDSQIKCVGELLLLWNLRYGIPLDYNEDMWEISDDALKSKEGVWSHTSYREDKSDAHPQPELIEMLKMLKSLT